MDTTHPLGMKTSEIVVDGDDVNAFARQSVEIRRQGRHQRLSFTGFHFGYPAKVQRCSTHELHIKVALADDTIRCFTHDCKCFNKKVIQFLATVKS